MLHSVAYAKYIAYATFCRIHNNFIMHTQVMYFISACCICKIWSQMQHFHEKGIYQKAPDDYGCLLWLWLEFGFGYYDLAGMDLV